MMKRRKGILTAALTEPVQDARMGSEKIMKFFSPLLFCLGQSEVPRDPEAGEWVKDLRESKASISPPNLSSTVRFHSRSLCYMHMCLPLP